MSYEVRLTPAAARQFRKLGAERQTAVRKALRKAATLRLGERGGKSLELIRGQGDDFYRLRVGDHRVVFDLLEDEPVLLVLGIVDRRDLERWLRGH